MDFVLEQLVIVKRPEAGKGTIRPWVLILDTNYVCKHRQRLHIRHYMSNVYDVVETLDQATFNVKEVMFLMKMTPFSAGFF
jgi:hypothetical protein